jgi:hypothetical protein
MNYLKTVLYSALFVAAANFVAAQTTFTVKNFRYSTNTSNFFETTSAGIVTINGDANFTPPMNNVSSGPLDIELRLTGLDLDSVGTDDDYINFTLRVTPYEATAQVAVSGQGIGLKNSSDSVNDNLQPGEELMFEVINLTIGSSGVTPAGAVTFDGFTAGALGGGINGFAYSTVKINGETAEISATNSGYQYVSNKANFAASSSVVFDNITATAQGAVISGGASVGETASALLTNRVRGLDYGFTYDPAGTPVVAPVVLTANDLGIRDNATLVYPTSGGGASTGSIIANSDQPFTNAEANVLDVALRWTGLDLDNDGNADDYFNFTIRAYDKSGTAKASLAGTQGWGVNGGNSWGVDTGEGLVFAVVNIEPSADAVGSVEFVGFTEATIISVGSAGAGQETTGSGSLDVNGTNLTATLNGTGWVQAQNSLGLTGSFESNPPSQITFDNASFGAGSATPTVHPRAFDLKFQHSLYGSQAAFPSNEINGDADVTINRNPNNIAGNPSVQSDGSIISLADGYDITDTTANPNGPQIDVPLVWSNLDVDGDGIVAEGESISFTVRYSTPSGSVAMHNDGIMVNGDSSGVGAGNSINGTESINVEVLYPEVNGITEGGVRFVGFNEVGMIVFGSPGAGNPTSGTATIDINGSTLTGVLDGSSNGFVSLQPVLALVPPAPELIIDNVIRTAGSVTPSVKLRKINFSFAYSPDYAVNLGQPDQVLSAENVSFRGIVGSSSAYIYSEWNTEYSAGSMAEPTGLNIDTLTDANVLRIPVRWTVDLNNDSTDDYIDFELVATAGSDTDVAIQNEGIGVNESTRSAALQPGEELTFTVENLTVDPALGGVATFAGFTGGKYFASGGTADLDTTIGSFSGDFNGNTVSINLQKDDGGYINGTGVLADIEPAVQSLLANNFVLSSGDPDTDGSTMRPGARVRGLSFKINYFEGNEATTTTPDTPVITGSGFVDADTFYIEFNPGGVGYKVTTPTSGGLDFANGTSDVTTSVTPDAADDNRFEFDPVAGQNFFRIESN